MTPVQINPDRVVASETVIVHDEALGIDRQIIAGQQVPPDLIDAYEAKTSKSSSKDKSGSGSGSRSSSEKD